MISNAMSLGVTGVQNAQRGMQEAAGRIAQTGTVDAPSREVAPDKVGGNTDSLAESLVDLKVNQRNAEASVEVVRTADDMVGTLLDERA